MISIPYIRTCIKLIILMLWTPTVALAAGAPFDGWTALFSIPYSVYIITFTLSTLSGVTALLIRLDAALAKLGPDDKLPYPLLFVTSHMSGSWLAAICAFAVGEAQKLPVWSEVILIITASFVGAKFIEMLAEKWVFRSKS